MAEFLLMYKRQQGEQTVVRNRMSSGLVLNTAFVIRQLLFLYFLSVFLFWLQGHFVEEAEAMENSATADSTSRLINPNNILPALRCFLEQHRK